MKLYYSPGACSLVPHILIKETGIAADTEMVNLPKHETASGQNFYEINAKGSVPLLVMADGERLSEGPVICQYICDQAQRTDLMPAAGTLARYRVMEWQNYITSEIHKSFGPLFNPTATAEIKAFHTKLLQQRLAWVSSQLDGRTYLTGDTFTAADAYLFVTVSWAAYVALDLSANTALMAFMERVKARPAVLAALKAEGLIK
jgi:glutathione S-transferase